MSKVMVYEYNTITLRDDTLWWPSSKDDTTRCDDRFAEAANYEVSITK